VFGPAAEQVWGRFEKQLGHGFAGGGRQTSAFNTACIALQRRHSSARKTVRRLNATVAAPEIDLNPTTPRIRDEPALKYPISPAR